MALDNFYNLKEKKKEQILKAISDCLRVHNYDDLSINDIAVEADISRGSFYNYFLDKNDAIQTLLISKLYSLEDIFKKTIEDCDGNLFDGALKTYDLIKGVLTNQIYLEIVKNLTHFVDLVTKIVYSDKYAEELERLLDWLVANTVEGKTILNSKKKMANTLDMIIALLSNTTLRIVTDVKMNRKYDDFNYKLNIIKQGIKTAD